jgi:hypothetical protein
VPQIVPTWLTIIIPIAGSGLVGLAVWRWNTRPRLVMELRGWTAEQAYDIEAERMVRVVSFNVWLGNDGSTIARRVLVEAFLDEETIAMSHALDVPPNSELQKRFTFPLREPEQAEMKAELGELRPTFHGRTLRARARAENTRRVVTVVYANALEPADDDRLYL